MWLQPSFLLAVLASCFFLTAAHAQTQDTPARFQTDDELINQVSQAQSDDELFDTRHSKTWLEVWGFHDAQGSDSAVNTIQPRLYHSFPIGTSGAQGLTRLDTSFNSTSGPLHSGSGGGAFNPTTTRWTMAAYTPETDQRLTFGGGFRMMLPTGYNNPAYSPSQWAMGPQLSMTYTPKNAGTFSFFSPTLRYMMGMTPVAPQVTLMRTLEIYPSTGFQLTPKLKLAMWDETGIYQSARTGKWFVPADAMLTYSFDQHWGATIGASVPIINNDFHYFWNTYSRIIYNF